ncbi:hypothetical protein [Paenibacillus alginolyticus]|uniref:hypothetical protein n=1 Tax=Paenibacillus alginolyticus TaxID=59839 RepID=UPI001C27693D|nr:hypothetical protein [Paenibacillus frigoriresistens]
MCKDLHNIHISTHDRLAPGKSDFIAVMDALKDSAMISITRWKLDSTWDIDPVYVAWQTYEYLNH